MNTTTIGNVKKGICGRGLSAALALAAGIAGLGALTAQGAIAIWDGATSANWSEDNWSGGGGTDGAPVSGVDSLRWTSTSTKFKISTNDIDGLSVTGINFQSAPSGIELNGNKVTVTGTIGSSSGAGSGTIKLPIELNAASITIGKVGGDTITINGIISEIGGSRAVRVENGNITLSGANSFSGNVGIGYTTASGTATLNINTLTNFGANQPLGSGSLVTLGFRTATGSVIYTGGATSTDKGFAIGENGSTGSANVSGAVGRFINNGSGAVTWTGAQTKLNQGATTSRTFVLGGSNTDLNTWQSVIDNNNAGTIGLTKIDAGKWILSGNNLYDGPTAVNGGTLVINGNQSGATGTVTVVSGAALGGDGRIGGAVTLATGGALKPYDTGSGVPSKLTLAGGFAYSAGTLDLSELSALASGTHVLAEFPSQAVGTFAAFIGLPSGASVGYSATQITLTGPSGGTLVKIR